MTPEAQAYGRATAAKLLRGRKGHGGGPCSRRVFNEAELAALAAIIWQAGWDASRASPPSWEEYCAATIRAGVSGLQIVERQP